MKRSVWAIFVRRFSMAKEVATEGHPYVFLGFNRLPFSESRTRPLMDKRL